MWFLPSERIARNVPKLDGRAIPGIFVGYGMKFGCRWNGGYMLIPKAALETWKKGRKLEAGIVREIVWDPKNVELVFPCRETLDQRQKLLFQNLDDEDFQEVGESMLPEDVPDGRGEATVC